LGTLTKKLVIKRPSERTAVLRWFGVFMKKIVLTK
jgi:hypothetical protein